jgi:hypothetical protein
MQKDNPVSEFIYLLCAVILAGGIYLAAKELPRKPRYSIANGIHGVFIIDTASGHAWRYHMNNDGTEGFVLMNVQKRTEKDWRLVDDQKWH